MCWVFLFYAAAIAASSTVMLVAAAASSSSSSSRSSPPANIDGDAATTNIYEGVPWQEQADLASVEPNINMKLYQDMPPIIFSPNGRIHQIESAKTVSKMVSPMSNIVLALKYGGGRNNKGRGGILILSTIPTSPYLQDIHEDYEDDDEDEHANDESNDEQNKNRDEKTEDRPTDIILTEDTRPPSSSLFLFEETWREATTTGQPIFGIHPDCEGILAATAGNTVDNTLLRQRIIAVGEQAAMQDEVSVLEALSPHHNHEPTKTQNSQHVNVYALAREFANLLQVPTQDMGQAAQQGFPKLIAVRSVLVFFPLVLLFVTVIVPAFTTPLTI